MFRQNATNEADNRLFRIEISMMPPTQETDRRKFQIRRSGQTSVVVPYERMSDEFKRINRLGGKIVKIEPVTAE
ncbi:MAG: phycobilisome linker polypeptide [Spirulinaceae cyanobacterium SM2_1_0]|nr:phycobilisome linker polypeptide [Spirulinaceae cyanobacterium SM2_1_0]